VNLYFEKHTGLTRRDTIFIHGNLASSKWWRPTVEAWRAAGSLGPGALYLADWRGCGQNPEWAQDHSFTLRDLAADFLELIENENLGECDLVGHSLGGLIALQMMQMSPKRFARAVLLDPVGAEGVVFDEGMYEAFRQMAAQPELTKAVILSTVRATLEPGFAETIAADAFKAVRGIGTSVLEILKSVDLRKDLRTVDTPTLILHGAHDAIIPLVDSEKLAKILLNAQFEILPEAGHCWNVEDPKAFTARVRAWL
jgi:pimeloyl-ACP methyl ester carboxylesterase